MSAVDRSRQSRFVFLDVMRGIAPVLVIYSHVVALFLDPHKEETGVVNLLSEQFRDPLRLEQHMGHLAVVLFFLVSGFIITQVGTQESHREFGIKRLFRVYPLLIVTVGLTAALSIWHLEVLRTGQHFEITLQSVLTNFALANYFMVPQVILVGVAWTLVIEVIFYTIVMSLLAVLRRWAWLAILIELGMVLAALLLAREFGPSFFLLAVNMSYLPVVLLGQVTWAVWSKRVPLWAGVLLGFACWTLYVLGDIRNMGRLDDAYSSTAALGFGIFIALLLAEQVLRPTKPISYLADRSYSLYLLHGPVAFPVFEALYGKLPLLLVVIIGLALTVGAAEVTFRFVEQPGQRIGRKLSKRYRLKKRITAREAEPPPEEPKDQRARPVPAYVDPPTRPVLPSRPAPGRAMRPPVRVPRPAPPRDRNPAPAYPTEPPARRDRAQQPVRRVTPPLGSAPAWPTEHPAEDVPPARNGHSVPRQNGHRRDEPVNRPFFPAAPPAHGSGRHRRESPDR